MMKAPLAGFIFLDMVILPLMIKIRVMLKLGIILASEASVGGSNPSYPMINEYRTLNKYQMQQSKGQQQYVLVVLG